MFPPDQGKIEVYTLLYFYFSLAADKLANMLDFEFLIFFNSAKNEFSSFDLNMVNNNGASVYSNITPDLCNGGG